MKKRESLPARTKKIIFQEAASQCVFCEESDVSALEIHHIISIENSGSSEPDNLILICANCHSKITQGVISTADVVTKKRELIYGKPRQRRTDSSINEIKIGGNVSNSIIANTVRLSGKSTQRMQYPAGSVGIDLNMKNYIDYLIKKYYDFRKADTSFGAYSHATNFHHSEIHTSIQSKFKARTFFVPQARFIEECDYIKGRINRTILGKRNRKQGVPNYGSFEDYVLEQNQSMDK